MANSRFEYVRELESKCTIMKNCWIVVEIERKCSAANNDDDHHQADALNFTAFKVMKAFREIILTFGGGNKYSFVLHRKADIYNRRAAKISSCILSTFTAFNTMSCVTSDCDPGIPIFYASTYVLPTDEILQQYLRSTQSQLGGPNDLLTKRPGTFLRKSVRLPQEKIRIHILPFYVNYFTDEFWQQHSQLLVNDRPDEYELNSSILCPLMAQIRVGETGSDRWHYELWSLYQKAVAESRTMTSEQSNLGTRTISWTEHEIDDIVPANAWIVVRIDGKGFHKFSEKNKFEKPNDEEALNLMNFAAVKVMSIVTDIVLSFGQSDEYSFVLTKNSRFCHRRASKIESIINSIFTSQYIKYWNEWLPGRPMNGLPTFDARTVPYDTDQLLRDYLSWRQADVHINNLYNTCFWKLVCDKQMANAAAEEYLRVHGTYSDDKRRLLSTMFNIDYDELPEMYKKGTILLPKLVKDSGRLVIPYHTDMIGDQFWSEHSEILDENHLIGIAELEQNSLPKLCLEQLSDSSRRTAFNIPSDDGVQALPQDHIKGLLCRCPSLEQHSFVPGCWYTVHIRGNNFREFSQIHEFERPNDDRGLDLVNDCALEVARDTNAAFVYTHSDEIVLVYRPDRRLQNIERAQEELRYSDIFETIYASNWSRWFPKTTLQSLPKFRAALSVHATETELTDYLNAKQHEAHKKNLQCTVFWNLVASDGCTMEAADVAVANASIADQNELLFQEFGINYNNMPVRHKKGTIWLRKLIARDDGNDLLLFLPYCRDFTADFWREHSDNLGLNRPAAVDLAQFDEHELIRSQMNQMHKSL